MTQEEQDARYGELYDESASTLAVMVVELEARISVLEDLITKQGLKIMALEDRTDPCLNGTCNASCCGY